MENLANKSSEFIEAYNLGRMDEMERANQAIKYNGWTNYATWTISEEWLDSDHWNGFIIENFNKDCHPGDVAEFLKDSIMQFIKNETKLILNSLSDIEFKEDSTSILPPIFSYAEGFLSSVNWRELAKHLISDIDWDLKEQE